MGHAVEYPGKLWLRTDMWDDLQKMILHVVVFDCDHVFQTQIAENKDMGA